MQVGGVHPVVHQICPPVSRARRPSRWRHPLERRLSRTALQFVLMTTGKMAVARPGTCWQARNGHLAKPNPCASMRLISDINALETNRQRQAAAGRRGAGCVCGLNVSCRPEMEAGPAATGWAAWAHFLLSLADARAINGKPKRAAWADPSPHPWRPRRYWPLAARIYVTTSMQEEWWIDDGGGGDEESRAQQSIAEQSRADWMGVGEREARKRWPSPLAVQGRRWRLARRANGTSPRARDEARRCRDEVSAWAGWPSWHTRWTQGARSAAGSH